MAAAWKIITDVLVVRESRHTVARTPTGPQIYLPEKKPWDKPEIYLPAEEPEEPDPPQEDINTPAPRRGMKHRCVGIRMMDTIADARKGSF